MGLSCGLAFWGLVAGSGMGAVLQSSAYLLTILKILGGLYLFWLAYQAARSAWQADQQFKTVSRNRSWFLQGILLNLSNPKAVFAWMAALSVGLSSNDNVYAIATATLACIAAGLVGNLLYSIVFSIGGVMQTYRRIRRWVDGAVAGMFAFAGFSLIRSSFSRSS